jgi:hypothetical protein
MINYTIKIKDDDLYNDCILNLFEQELPGSTKNKDSIFESIITELIGTKQHRNGPTPNPEILVSIRNIVRNYIEKDEPIKILVPWGGSKQGKHEVDIAELFAIKQLLCLDERIKKHYRQGVDIIIRLEDLTDHILFRNQDEWVKKTNKYCDTLFYLMAINGIYSIKESSLMIAKEFLEAQQNYSERFEKILHGNETISDLNNIGWSGQLSFYQVKHYLDKYNKLYPELNYDEQVKLLADYFACALARKNLNGTGMEGDYLTLSFESPIPGVSKEKKLFYRTIPERYTRKTCAPWMVKGYLKIHGNIATPTLASWDTMENYYKKIIIINDLEIQSDYLIME